MWLFTMHIKETIRKVSSLSNFSGQDVVTYIMQVILVLYNLQLTIILVSFSLLGPVDRQEENYGHYDQHYHYQSERNGRNASRFQTLVEFMISVCSGADIHLCVL